jgi:hypothetical protein
MSSFGVAKRNLEAFQSLEETGKEEFLSKDVGRSIKRPKIGVQNLAQVETDISGKKRKDVEHDNEFQSKKLKPTIIVTSPCKKRPIEHEGKEEEGASKRVKRVIVSGTDARY